MSYDAVAGYYAIAAWVCLVAGVATTNGLWVITSLLLLFCAGVIYFTEGDWRL